MDPKTNGCLTLGIVSVLLAAEWMHLRFPFFNLSLVNTLGVFFRLWHETPARPVLYFYLSPNI